MLALAGLGVVFGVAGLDKADKLASVIGAFVAVVGLMAALYGLVKDRRDTSTGKRGVPVSGERPAEAGENSGIAAMGDGARNVQLTAEASGKGRVYQAGRDQTINER